MRKIYGNVNGGIMNMSTDGTQGARDVGRNWTTENAEEWFENRKLNPDKSIRWDLRGTNEPSVKDWDPAFARAEMLTDDTTKLLEFSSKYAVNEYSKALEEWEGCIHDAITVVSLTEETENEVGGTRAVKVGDENDAGSKRPWSSKLRTKHL